MPPRNLEVLVVPVVLDQNEGNQLFENSAKHFIDFAMCVQSVREGVEAFSCFDERLERFRGARNARFRGVGDGATPPGAG